MVGMVGHSLIAAGIAFLVSSLAIPVIRRFALAVRAVDYPGGRRHQAEGIPRLGGVAVAIGLFAAQGVIVAFQWSEWKADLNVFGMFAIPLAFFIIFLCGLLEDIVGLSPLTRVLMQIAAAALVIKVDWSFETISIPFIGNLEFGILTVLISIAWIVGVTNAVNLLDGLDGLAGGVVAIIAASLMIFSIVYGDFLAAMILGTMVGACLGFLRKNWQPAQIYMGDAGSLTLGFMLAVISVHASLKTPAFIAILVPILALGLPVIDTLLVMMFRFTQKSHGSLVKRTARVFKADRSHLHHLMLKIGPLRSRIVLWIYAIVGLFCAMAFLAAIVKDATLGFFLILVEILVIFGIRQLGLHADVHRMSIEKRQSVREILFNKALQIGRLRVARGKNAVPPESVAGRKARGAEAVAGRKSQVAETVAGRKSQVAETVAGRKSQVAG